MLTEGKRMPTAQDLREQRANIWSQMTEIMDRTDRSGDDDQTYDRLEADYDRLEEQIGRLERHADRAALNARLDRSGVVAPDSAGDDAGPDDAAYATAFKNFLRDGMADLDPEDKKLMRGRQVTLPKNAAGVGTGSAGGYAVPPAFRDVFVQQLKWYGPMIDEAEIIETDSGVNMPWPTNDDTSNVGAILAENTQMAEQDVTLGQASIDAFMYYSKLVRVSFQTIQDVPNFETWLAKRLGERVGRILNQHFTTGTGTAQPDGIVTSSTVAVTGTGSLATTGGFAYANLVDLLESLDPAYGGGNNLKWMGHQSVRKALRKLLDAQNRPLWEPSLQAGQPDMLMGYPFRLNNDMATVAQNSKSLGFGDIRQAYMVRIVRELSLLRLSERYADFLQVAFAAYERADGTMQNTSAFKIFQTTATA
jgi:HK97 family phage major capsid protein